MQTELLYTRLLQAILVDAQVLVLMCGMDYVLLNLTQLSTYSLLGH